MRHVKITISQAEGNERDILIAQLAEHGFDGFEESEDALYAYLPEEQFSEVLLNAVLSPVNIAYTKEFIEPQNWNKVWESSFQPVVVDDFCTIMADFHTEPVSTPYCIEITPKMSFGTGHHATTQLMMTAMKEIPFAGKSVLDFGTGTGVLAILAAMLGATSVMAIDNDSWSVENAMENTTKNKASVVTVALGSLEDMGTLSYDVILANINRHILLEHMAAMHSHLAHNGVLLMSGLLTDDEEIVANAALEAGFTVPAVNTLNGWISIYAIKQ